MDNDLLTPLPGDEVWSLAFRYLLTEHQRGLTYGFLINHQLASRLPLLDGFFISQFIRLSTPKVYPHARPDTDLRVSANPGTGTLSNHLSLLNEP